LALAKPTNRNLAKPKRMHPQPQQMPLQQAAATATYVSSPYHCPGPKGQKRVVRLKPASPCPRIWTVKEATVALRCAIASGQVSEKWEDGFPRYVWHREAATLYEARHSRGPVGSFHAYPIGNDQAPKGLAI